MKIKETQGLLATEESRIGSANNQNDLGSNPDRASLFSDGPKDGRSIDDLAKGTGC